jgi:uncharacterized protein
MNNYYNQSWTHESGKTYSVGQVNSFLRRVFLTMFAGLLITGITATLMGIRMENDQLVAQQMFGGSMRWVMMFAPLGILLIISFGLKSMSILVANIMFGVFCAVMGLSLSWIFLAYTNESIMLTFFITSSIFGAMAVVGYTTKLDLTKMGSYLLMGLMGIVIASVVNLFMNSGPLGFIISIVGVLVFTGLTAYDVQRLKRMEYLADGDPSVMHKASIMGAITLYLNFINLFMLLLRLTGSRD